MPRDLFAEDIGGVDLFAEGGRDLFADTPTQSSSGIGEIFDRMLGLPAQAGVDLAAGAASFFGGLPYWPIELIRSGGDVASANRAYEATSGDIYNKIRPEVTSNPWVQEYANKIMQTVGEGFEWTEEKVAAALKHIEPTMTDEQAKELSKPIVLFGSLGVPKVAREVSGAIRGTPEPPLIRLPKETPPPGKPFKPTYERYSPREQLDMFPEKMKEMLPEVKEGVEVAPPIPREPVQPSLFDLPPVEGKPSARIFQESSIVDPRYVPPGFFDTGMPKVGAVPTEQSPYKWQENPSNLIDNLYVRALKAVGKDETHPLYAGLRKMEADVFIKRSEFDPIRDQMLEMYRRMAPLDKKNVDRELFSATPSKAKEIFDRYYSGKGTELFNSIKGALDTRYKDLKEVYPSLKYTEDYFPRIVKDVEGLVSTLKKKGDRTKADKIVDLQNRYTAGTIDFMEFQNGMNDLIIRGGKPNVRMPTSKHAKKRSYTYVPEELQKYYEHPIKALNEYFGETGQVIAERKFLGKGETGEAIAARMKEAVDKGVFNKEQALAFEEILKLRFSPEARRGAGPWSRTAKDIGYAGTIANPLSAAIQTLDVIPSAARYGVINTMNAAFKSALPKFIRNKTKTLEPAAVGLKDISHDINVSVGTVGYGAKGGAKVADVANFALDKLLQLSSFKMVDRFGKRTLMTAALNKFAKKAASKGGDKFLERKGFRNYYKTEAEWKSFKDALARKDVADPRVREAMVMELLDIQPISISSMPIAYIRHPQGRIFYMLKTWALRQLNAIRESNLKGRRGEAFKLAGALVVSNYVGPYGRDLIRSLWGNENIDEKSVSDRAVAAFLRMIFLDKYATSFNQAESAGSGVKILSKALTGESIAGAIMPPQFDMVSAILNDIGKFLDGELGRPKIADYVPITGPWSRDMRKLEQ